MQQEHNEFVWEWRTAQYKSDWQHFTFSKHPFVCLFKVCVFGKKPFTSFSVWCPSFGMIFLKDLSLYFHGSEPAADPSFEMTSETTFLKRLSSCSHVNGALTKARHLWRPHFHWLFGLASWLTGLSFGFPLYQLLITEEGAYNLCK